jgi:transposase
MNYVGVDLHKQTSWFYVLNERGKKTDSINLSNNLEILKNYFKKIPKPFTLAVEATYNWYFFVDLAREYTDKVYLANSYELKAFAKRHKKTDRIDARLIATVLYKGYLPTVAIADKHTREVRELLRYRIKLVSDRTRNISRLKALLDKLGCISTGDYTTRKALKNIARDQFTDNYGSLIDKYRELITHLSGKICEIEKEINKFYKYDEDIHNLLDVPGLGPFSAALVKSEIIDIERFRSFNRLCAYSGLAPRVSASADKLYHGPLNKNRCKNIQWILLETVRHFVNADPARITKFKSIERRKGYNTAKVALARDYLKVIYHVLKEKRPYYKPKQEYKIQSVAATALVGV